METEQIKETKVKQTKQPRLDVGGPAQAAALREMAPVLEALKANPLVDERTGTLTPAGRQWEADNAEAFKASIRKTDEFAAAEEKRRLQREADKARALILDARLAALRIRIPAVCSAFRAYGDISPEAQALANRALNDLNVDVQDVMKRSGLDGAEALIEDHEQRVLPELKEKCLELQNAFMTKLAVEREKLTAEQALEKAKKLGPDKGLKYLEANGLRLRVNEGELETAGPIDEAAMAILKMYRPAILEALRQRDQWRRLP